VLWALEELAAAHGLEYEFKTYARKKGAAPEELKAIFPLGKSPVLTVDGPLASDTKYTIKSGVVTESRLILQFISDNYAKGIWEPASAEEKNRDIFFQEFANSTLTMKVDFALIFDVIPPNLPFPIRQITRPIITTLVKYWIKDLQAPFQLMEDALSEDQPWFAGRRIGLADFNMSWGMDLAVTRGYFDAKKYPKVSKWHEKITQRPAYKSALEKGGPYDLVNF
jgi:glutathione S-transferase